MNPKPHSYPAKRGRGTAKGGGAGRPGEFELIARYFAPLATDRAALGLADDAAQVRLRPGEDLVVTTDLVAAGVHFFADDPPEAIAHKALRVNLSDLAAKGAQPVGYLLALALPADWTEAWIARFARGLAADQAAYRISLLGGDTSRAANGLTATITALGRLPRGAMVHRAGARPGDLVYVSGTIGDAALGLALRLGKVDRKAAGRGAALLLDRYLHPQPRMRLASAIRRYASSALDVSDGLIGDFAHICDASKVGGLIDAAKVPLSAPATKLVRTEPQLLELALTGGDDYEILATIAPRDAASFERAARRAAVSVTQIGRVTEGQGRPVVVGNDGEPLVFGHASFDHFR
jgi:thiamine-monophosphate kinase